MSLRKIAGLLAAFGITLGLIGSGVGASFIDQVTGTESIAVGSFACRITDATAGSTIAGDQKSVSYTAPTINSSAAGSAPFSFTVQNTGTIDQVLTTSMTNQGGNLGGHFSPIPATPSPVALAAGASQAISTGIQWTTLDSGDLGRAGSMTWTASCAEAVAVGPVVFGNTPAVLPANLPSYGPEAYAFNEWGPGVTLAGTERKLTTSTVTMSSWACETGSWTVAFGNPGACVTTPGATYPASITFNVYGVTGTDAVGSLIATTTQTFQIPFRPSSIAGGDGETWNGTSHGLANNITFSFAQQVLPSSVIFGITFNTDNYGYSPIHGSGSPTDSLNIATYPGTGIETAPSTGAWLPDGHSTYLATGPAGSFAGPVVNMPTGPADTFGGYMPAISITAVN